MLLGEILKKYTNVEEMIWVQEEPKNQGAYTHVRDRIDSLLVQIGWKGKALRYVGRRESAIPAPGVGKLYQTQQKGVVEETFRGM